MTDLDDRIAEVLDRLEPGEVVTYGEVAAMAGRPEAPRAVGRFLAETTGHPWWRVVNSAGRLAPGSEVEQARRLRAEGIAVEGNRVVGMKRR
ncbi:MAG TPA: MGMT family protein [Acidimicrobiia bacterium]|nr:MGMT family protein [Acidimicrobiia bacterium]